MLSTFLHNSWERGYVNLMISPDLADDMIQNQILKQVQSRYVACNLTFGGAKINIIYISI